jgi:hypothetical protein
MANLEEAVVATLWSQKDKTADTILRHDPLLSWLKENNRYKVRSLGDHIRKSVRYNSTRQGGFYRGFDTFNLDSLNDLTAFRFPIKQCYEPFGISGRDKRANAGDENRLLDLIDEKMEGTLSRLKNTVSTSVLGDGTAFGGAEFDGLKKMVSISPTQGTYGQVDRTVVTNTFAQNQKKQITLTAANIQETITDQMIPITRGTMWPDVGFAGSTAWKLLHKSLTAIQRINDSSKTGKGGFRELMFNGSRFWYDGGYGGLTLGANYVYLLNSEFITFEVDSGADFVPLDPKMARPINQDGFFTIIIVEGNLCCSAPVLQNVIYDA